MLLSQIITVNIDLQAAQIERTAFGYPLILGDIAVAKDHGFPPAWATRITSYTTLAGLSGAGFSTSKSMYKCAEAMFAQNPRPARVYVGYYDSTGGAEDPGQGLDAIALLDNSWYGAVLIDRGSAKTHEQEHVAIWVQASARPKIAGFATNDTAMYTGPDASSIGYLISTGTGKSRSFAYYDHNASDKPVVAKGFPEAALMAKMFAGYQTGAATWAFKQPSGIDAAKATGGIVDLTSAQELEIFEGGTPNKNANCALTVAGQTCTYWGTMGNGTYIDLIVGVDWLQATMQERIYAKRVKLGKIPFTNEGIGIFESELRGAFDEGIKSGFLSKLVYLTMPDEADVSDADKTARTLTGITFEAEAAGDIHKVTINGTITV